MRRSRGFPYGVGRSKPLYRLHFRTPDQRSRGRRCALSWGRCAAVWREAGGDDRRLHRPGTTSPPDRSPAAGGRRRAGPAHLRTALHRPCYFGTDIPDGEHLIAHDRSPEIAPSPARTAYRLSAAEGPTSDRPDAVRHDGCCATIPSASEGNWGRPPKVFLTMGRRSIISHNSKGAGTDHSALVRFSGQPLNAMREKYCGDSVSERDGESPHRRPREERSGAETRTHRASRGTGCDRYIADLSGRKRGRRPAARRGTASAAFVLIKRTRAAQTFDVLYVRDRGIYPKDQGGKRSWPVDRAYTRALTWPGWRKPPPAGLGFAVCPLGLDERGMQPFARGLTRWCNGLYGWRRQRAELEQRGYTFRSGSDCELLLPMYREYGRTCCPAGRGVRPDPLRWGGGQATLPPGTLASGPLLWLRS